MRIGVLSDTHIPTKARTLPARLFQAFEGVDLILHAGDLASEHVFLELSALAPVYAVQGNVDPPELDHLPAQREIVVAGKRIGLIHGHRGPGSSAAERAYLAFPGADCVVFGHTHRPYCERRGNTLLFNPGSPTDRRGEPFYSYGFLTIRGDEITAELVRFS